MLAIKKHDVKLVSCLADIRRKFFEARKNHPEKAEYALEQIQLMYVVEQIAREEGSRPIERLRLRKVMIAPMYYNLLDGRIEMIKYLILAKRLVVQISNRS